MTLGDKIQYLRKQKGLSQKELAEKLNIATGTLQQYELNKREPKLLMINKIANLLETSISSLVSDLSFGESTNLFDTGSEPTYVECNFCGFLFYPFNKYQAREHLRYHNKFKKIKEKFGDLLSDSEAEDLRTESIQIMNSSLSNNEDILIATENCLKAEFSQSLRSSGLDIDHIDFRTFCHMKLEQQWAIEVLPDDVYHTLIEKYKTDILYDGEYYPVCRRKENPLNDYSDSQPVKYVIESYPQLNWAGRKKVAQLLELLTRIPEYLTEEEKEIRKMHKP